MGLGLVKDYLTYYTHKPPMRLASDYAKISSIMANYGTPFKVGFGRLNHVVSFCLALAFIIIALLAAIEIERFYRDKFLPNSFVNQIEVSNLTEAEALTKLATLNVPPAIDLTLTAANQTATLSAQQVAAHFDNAAALQELSSEAEELPWHQRYIKALGLGKTTNQETLLICDSNAITTTIDELGKRTHIPNKPPTIVLGTSGNKNSLKIDAGKVGFELDATKSASLLTERCAYREPPAPGNNVISLTITLPPVPPPTPLDEIGINSLRKIAEQLVGKQLALKIQNQTFYIRDQQIISFLEIYGGWYASQINEAVKAIGAQILTEPSDAVLEYDPITLKVAKFVPPRDGLTIDTTDANDQIVTALNKWRGEQPLADVQQDLTLKISAQKPNITLDKTNNLGINELVGFGDSAYAHSIPTRVHNVALTASKINFTIIKPGDEFSFNKTLGEVSKATGFQPAYVIKSGRTELGDGGGVCQVSSTLFRAVMNAGLNITKRKPHSYRVSYYELNSKAGFDATVYSGDVDFRFKNDTPGHLLIYTETDSKNLTMKIEIFGTSDGRVSTISDYKSWDARPPAATVYMDDPSLPPGKLKQIDWSAPGLKTSFVYTVKDKFGTVKQEETYYSNYLPWSAKYLRGPG